jgi:GMP synthase (glutamine-hydrolysing)
LKPVLCVSHEASVSPGIAAEVFDEAGVPFRMMRAWEETDWPAPDDIAGLVVLGGEMNAHEVDAFPFLKDVHAFTAGVVAKGVPVLGICLGAQILAIVLGGSVTRSPRVEIGFKLLDATIEGKSDPVLGGFADDIAVFQWHEDTFVLPPAVTLLLSGGGFDQAFRWGANCYGTQFHFEVTESDIAAWIEATPSERLLHYWGRSGEEVLAEARSKLPEQQDAARVAFRQWSGLLET